MDFFAGDFYDAVDQIDVQVTDANFGLRIAGWLDGDAAADGLNARLKLSHAEGFGEIVISAGIEGFNLGAVLVVDGEHDDRDLRPFAQAAAGFDAVDSRAERNVEDDQVGAVLSGLRERVLAIGHRQDLEAIPFEADLKLTSDLRLVIDHQYFEFHRQYPDADPMGAR